MPQKVFVTGFGIISCLGNNVEQNLQSLSTKRTGISPIKHLNTVHQQDYVLGEIDLSNEDLAALAGLGKLKNITRTGLLGLIALREAIEHAALDAKGLKKSGLVNGTTVGGMDVSEMHFGKYLNGETLDYIQAFAAHDCGHGTERMADETGINGYVSTISTACSSSANTIMHSAKLIKRGLLDVAIAGGTDALSLFTFNGFNTLKILDPAWCKPFDVNRKGLNLGEGAAYLVLESESSVEKRKAKVYAELTGYGNANDAYHQTASSTEGKGAYMAMAETLKMAGVKPADIGYINVHGTGTDNNDQSESVAVKTIFGDDVPPYSTTKAYTGHTLGAAGAIEAVFSLLTLNHKRIFPCLNISQPMEVLAKKPVMEVMENQEVRHVLSNSFGFGGNCSSLLFSN